MARALQDVLSQTGWKLVKSTPTQKLIEKDGVFSLYADSTGWVQLFTPIDEDVPLAEALSRELGAPVFHFHIHDGDLWMYNLLVEGKCLDQFNQRPDYWSEIPDDERKRWKGNAEVVAKVFGVDANRVAPYLRFASDVNDDEKAFESDENPIASEWAMVDFQARIGIHYPDFSQDVELLQMQFGWVGVQDRTDHGGNKNVANSAGDGDRAPKRKPWYRFW